MIELNYTSLKVEELDEFLESSNPAAQLAKDERCYFCNKCENCDKEFEAIIYGGRVNYYLCYEHLVELENLLCAALS